MWAYVRWWVRDHRKSRLVIGGPLLFVFGIFFVLLSAAQLDWGYFWRGAIMLALGSLILLSPVKQYRRSQK